MRHLAVVGGVALVSGVVVASAIYRRRAALRSRLSRWTEALELVKAFGDSSGLEAELSPGRSPLRNFALTSAVQALTDRRAAAAAQLGSAHAAALSPASLREASRYMRFASAAYGAALMALFGLLPPPTREQLELSVEARDHSTVGRERRLLSNALLAASRRRTAPASARTPAFALRTCSASTPPRWTWRAPSASCATSTQQRGHGRHL